jgi:hypothetical protein
VAATHPHTDQETRSSFLLTSLLRAPLGYTQRSPRTACSTSSGKFQLDLKDAEGPSPRHHTRPCLRHTLRRSGPREPSLQTSSSFPARERLPRVSLALCTARGQQGSLTRDSYRKIENYPFRTRRAGKGAAEGTSHGGKQPEARGTTTRLTKCPTTKRC